VDFVRNILATSHPLFKPEVRSPLAVFFLQREGGSSAVASAQLWDIENPVYGSLSLAYRSDSACLLAINPIDPHAQAVKAFAGSDEERLAVFASKTYVCGPVL
jgi:hypothetical protein